MTITRRSLLAAAATLPAVARAQGKYPEARQDQVKEAARDAEREGTIVDRETGAAIAGAIVTAGDRTVLTDAKGHYRAPAATQPLQVRAVGRACGANPVALAIPCHRVVAAGGGLGGYRWGVERKRQLLEAERNRQEVAAAAD